MLRFVATKCVVKVPKTAIVGLQKNMARLTKVYNTDDDDSGYVGRRHLPLVAGDKLMVSHKMRKGANMQ